MDTSTWVTIILTAYTYFFMTKVVKNSPKDEPLTKNEKIQTIILLITNTLLSFIVLYMGWKQKLPMKAKQVRTYVMRIVGVLLGIALLGIVVAVLLTAINPQRQVERANQQEQVQQ